MYDATKAMQNFIVILYHGSVIGILTVMMTDDPYLFERDIIKKFLFYKLVPFQLAASLGLAFIVQFFICMC